MNILIPGLTSERFKGLTYSCNIKNDEIIICDVASDYVAYAENICSIINDDFDNLIIDASLLLIQNDKNTDYRGIELLKWLRIKHKLVNPIFIVGAISLDLLLTKYPNQIIVTAPGTKYFTFDGFKNNFLDYSNAIYPVENFETTYKPYVLADFTEFDKSHQLANDYGYKKLHNFLLSFIEDSTETLKDYGLIDHKAEFLYPKDESYDIIHCKKKLEELSTLYAQGLVNEEAINLEGNLKHHIDKLKVIYIDDQGKNKWFDLIRKLLGKSADINFITPNENCFNLIERANPQLIFLDLRLEGVNDEKKELDKISGALLLKRIKKWNPKLPVVILSATDKMDSMRKLKSYPYCAYDLWTKPRVESKTTIYQSFKSFVEVAKKTYHHALNDGELTVSAIQYALERDRDSKDRNYRTSLVQNEQNPLNTNEITRLLFDTNYFVSTDASIINRWRAFNHLVHYNKIQPIVISEVLAELYNLTIKQEITKETNWERLFTGDINELISYLKKRKAKENAELAKFAINYLRENILRRKVSNKFKDYQQAIHNNIEFQSSKLEGRPEGANYCVGAHRKILVGNFLNEENARNLVEVNRLHGSKTLLHADPALSAMVNFYCLKDENTIFVSNDLDCKRQVVLNFPSVENNVDEVYLKREEDYNIHIAQHTLNFKNTNLNIYKNNEFLKLFHFVQ